MQTAAQRNQDIRRQEAQGRCREVPEEAAGRESRRAILVVSFGTSCKEQREAAIGAVERAVKEAFPDWEIRRAFTSRMIINKMRENGEGPVDSVGEALERLYREGFEEIAVQPTHVMSGLEYSGMMEEIGRWKDRFCSVHCGKPLLCDSRDYREVVRLLSEETDGFCDGRTAIVCMGHGTEHEANQVYGRLFDAFGECGKSHIYIGTVEAEPSLRDVMNQVEQGDYRRVVLLPLMIVAGDHANNDMAGDEEDSWRNAFRAAGYEVECVLRGMGEYRSVQQLFVEHVREAVAG